MYFVTDTDAIIVKTMMAFFFTFITQLSYGIGVFCKHLIDIIIEKVRLKYVKSCSKIRKEIKKQGIWQMVKDEKS